jgi:carbonic anhydrase/acetyltransferase-like protein (isoleucine patch superfamily)
MPETQNIRPFGGRAPAIDPGAWVDPTALVIGDVSLGPRSSVWPMCVVRGDIHRIRIGAETNIQDGSVLHVSHDSRFLPGGAPLIIHERVTVGHQAVLHGCEIRELCLVGIGARVLDRAVLEPRTILGAGALVPPGKVLEGGYLWVGAPARRSRSLTDQELEYLAYTAANYVRLAAEHLDSGHAETPSPKA